MSKYYTSPPQVIDGDVAYARDVNDINNEADAGFASVEADFLSLSGIVQAWAEVAQAWAENPEDTEVEQGSYSSLHWAAKASASASAALASQNAAALSAVDAGTSATNAATSEANAAVSASSSATSEANAANSEASAATSETNAATSETNAATSETNAATSETNAATSAASASTSEANAAASASSASASAASASTDATSAAASAASAATSEANAATSETNAATSAASAAASAALVPDPSLGSVGDTILVNETQDGWIFGEGGGGGLKWSVVSRDISLVDGEGYLADTSASSLTFTMPASPTVGMEVGVKDYAGTFGTLNCTIGTSSDLFDGEAGPLVLDSDGFSGTLVYSGSSRGWLMVTATPMTTIQSKPLVHVQDQKITNTNGGSSVVGFQTRELNTVLTNDIQGAYLSSNSITLPAGTYYVEARAPHRKSGRSKLNVVNSSGTTLLEGQVAIAESTYLVAGTATCSGMLTLASSESISLSHYFEIAEANTGLGDHVGQGTEVYSDLKVWKLDAEKEYPRIYQPVNQLVPGVTPTGLVHGGVLTWLSDTEVSVGPYSATADDLETPLFNSSSTTLSVGDFSLTNTVYCIFACKLTDGSHVVRGDSDEYGANLGSDVIAKAFLGLVRVKSNGTFSEFHHSGPRLELSITDAVPIASGIPQSQAYTPDYAAVLPLSRIDYVGLWLFNQGATNAKLYVYEGGKQSRELAVSISPNYYRTTNPCGELMWVSTDTSLWLEGTCTLIAAGLMFRR